MKCLEPLFFTVLVACIFISCGDSEKMKKKQEKISNELNDSVENSKRSKMKTYSCSYIRPTGICIEHTGELDKSQQKVFEEACKSDRQATTLFLPVECNRKEWKKCTKEENGITTKIFWDQNNEEFDVDCET